MPKIDVIGIKLDIINASFAYGQAQNALGELGNIKMSDPRYREAAVRVQKTFQSIYSALNQLDALETEN